MSAPSLSDFLQRLRDLIADDDLEQALDQLRNFLYARAPGLYNEVLLQTRRLTAVRRDLRQKLLTREQYAVERAQLADALLGLLDEVPRQVERPAWPVVAPAPSAPERLPAPEGVAAEKIIGINNLKEIAWIRRGLDACRSVCRLLTPQGMGTGFLIAPGVLMTNNHVIPDAAVAAASVAEFNYQEDGTAKAPETARYDVDAAVFHTSPQDQLDYTLVGVKPAAGKPPLESWGRLALNANADPLPTEHVAIIQHPNGGLKQIVLTANWVMGKEGALLRYTTDTLPGSSGAPVFNDSWHVIALHHAGGVPHKMADGSVRYVNEGVLMSAIRPDAGGHWPGAA